VCVCVCVWGGGGSAQMERNNPPATQSIQLSANAAPSQQSMKHYLDGMYMYHNSLWMGRSGARLTMPTLLPLSTLHGDLLTRHRHPHPQHQSQPSLHVFLEHSLQRCPHPHCGRRRWWWTVRCWALVTVAREMICLYWDACLCRVVREELTCNGGQRRQRALLSLPCR
jgi:hypothetical protein